MIIQGQIGALATTASLAAGFNPNIRLGNMGDMVVSELHGRYYEGSYRRARYNIASPSGVTTSVGAATTYVGLCLSNPINAPVNLVLEKVGLGFLVVWGAAATLGLMCGFNSGTNVTHTTPLSPLSNLIGSGAAPYGKVDSSATLPTAPVLTHVFGAGLTGAITVQTAELSFFDLEGSVILAPGAYAAIYTSTASGTNSFFGSLSWEEVPL